MSAASTRLATPKRRCAATGKPCRGDEQRERECEHRRGGERDPNTASAAVAPDHVGERDVGRRR
jgi:hypothetical protein